MVLLFAVQAPDFKLVSKSSKCDQHLCKCCNNQPAQLQTVVPLKHGRLPYVSSSAFYSCFSIYNHFPTSSLLIPCYLS